MTLYVLLVAAFAVVGSRVDGRTELTTAYSRNWLTHPVRGTNIIANPTSLTLSHHTQPTNRSMVRVFFFVSYTQLLHQEGYTTAVVVYQYV